jgi:hypothetical protein
MNGFTAELLMAMITPKFLIVSLKSVGMSKYFRGLESINGAQKMKKKNNMIPIACADLVSFRNCRLEFD